MKTKIDKMGKMWVLVDDVLYDLGRKRTITVIIDLFEKSSMNKYKNKK